MKFFLFADYHYYPHGYINFGFDGLHKFQKIAEEKNCDMMIHLGDFCHGQDFCKDFIEEYVLFYLKQMIPATSIFRVSYDSNLRTLYGITV